VYKGQPSPPFSPAFFLYHPHSSLRSSDFTQLPTQLTTTTILKPNKMVSLRSLIAAAALIAAPVMAAVTPTQLTDGIKKVTMQSQMLQADAQSITILNAPLIIIGQGPFPVCLRPLSSELPQLTLARNSS
jgi:hypothetical protein